MQLLLATTNSGKLAELRWWLQDCGPQLVDLSDFPGLLQPAETGGTFARNARLKACAYSRQTRLPALADDSGLAVKALGGRPGVHSARLAGTDPERIQALLKLMEDVGPQSRQAAFVCAVCVCLPDGPTLEVEGRVEGMILTLPRGEGGFGYDPLFFFPPLDRTFGQLDLEEKNQISHRADALAQLSPQLLPFLSATVRATRPAGPEGHRDP